MSAAAHMDVQPLITYTLFPDVTPHEKTERADIPWGDLVSRIEKAPTYLRKGDCPLISIAEYGDLRTDKDCLRHAANVKRIFGVEIDYDGEAMPIEEAANILHAAEILSVLYTSPSHQPHAPRWRVLLPLAEPAAPSERARYVGRVNRLLGGVATRESFTLSQSFFIGRVKDAQYIVLETDGRCIDLAADIEPQYYAGNGSSGNSPRDPTTDEQLRARFKEGTGRYEAMLKLSSRWAIRGISAEDIETSLHALLDEGNTSANADGIDLRTRVRPIATSAHRKFGETRRVLKVDENVPRETHFAPPEQPDPWEGPVDLWTGRPVPRLQVEWLPEPLQEFTLEQSALTGTDPTIIGIACLVTCAGVIHDGLKVQPKAHDVTWTESARLWGAIIGDPSSKKSPGIGTAIRPLRKLEAQLAAQYEDTKANYDEAFQRWERSKASDKGPAPKKPGAHRMLVEDTTMESLTDILADNPQGIMAFRDELSGWFGAMDAYGKNGSTKDRSFWLEAYNGGPKRIDRVTRGHMFVPNCSVSLLGGIQPDAFAKIIKRLDHDGLLQRFMIVIGASAIEDEDRAANLQVIKDYADLIDDLSRLHASGGDRIFTLTEEAQVVRKTWMLGIRGMLKRKAVPEPMLGYLGKWEGLFARLLCVYHVTTYTARHKPIPAEIDESVAMTVCAFMECLLLPHALEFYGAMMYGSDRQQHAQWIAGYILANKSAELTTREIAQGYRAFQQLGDHERRSAWNALEESAWIRPAPASRVNKRSGIPTRWEVNPICHESFRERAGLEKDSRTAAKAQIEASAAIRRQQKQEGD